MRHRFFHSIFPFLLGLLTTCVSVESHAQSLSLFDLDARAYPLMRAKYLAFDADGLRLDALRPADVVLTENGVRRTVIDLRCPPPDDPAPLSSVLTIDVSGSMDGGRLAIARAAAGAWIEEFPFMTSECALTQFNTRNALLQDFTADPSALRDALQGLQAGGGTSFDAALIDPFAGALRIVERGRHKRVVVLLTDGQATGSEQAVLDAARQSGAQVFCVTVDDRMPDILRRVSEESGGRSFAGVKTTEHARHIFRSILQFSQDIEPCVVEWESGGCDYARSVEMRIPAHGIADRAGYSVTAAMLPDISFEPGIVVEFQDVIPGIASETTCILRARNRAVRIDAISPDDDRFRVVDYGGPAPPITLAPGESRTLTLRYLPLDSARVVCRFALATTACSSEFFATAGYPGKRWDERVLTLMHPNGGEVFVAGSDTVITWEGVTPDERVRLDFSADNGRSWSLIASGVTGEHYAWRVPLVSSDACLVRVTLEEELPVPDDMVLIAPGSFRRGDLTGTGTALERPAHDVRLTRAFLMSPVPVTQRSFIDVMGYNPSAAGGSDILPVTDVTWNEAIAYCNERSRLEGLEECYAIDAGDVTCDFSARGYRLPTEAEWECACRAGSSDEFSGGGMTEPYCDPVDPVLDTLAWYCATAGGRLHETAQLRPNRWGLYDMHGGVFEWCWDFLNVYQPDALVDPAGPARAAVGSTRVVRGGMYSSYAAGCRSSAREGMEERARAAVGFRVVRTY